MNKSNEPLELIAPVPIEWEIAPSLNNVWECSPKGTVTTCTSGTGNT